MKAALGHTCAAIIAMTLGGLGPGGSALAQGMQEAQQTDPYAVEATDRAEESPLAGSWSYRSFHNNPDLSVSFDDLRFGAGTLRIEEPSFGRLAGTLGGEGWNLNLIGTLTYGNPFSVRFQGVGQIGGETWVYDYSGYLAPLWPNGVGQRPAIVGTIVRTVPHSGGAARAGYVASWIAVRQD